MSYLAVDEAGYIGLDFGRLGEPASRNPAHVVAAFAEDFVVVLVDQNVAGTVVVFQCNCHANVIRQHRLAVDIGEPEVLASEHSTAPQYDGHRPTVLPDTTNHKGRGTQYLHQAHGRLVRKEQSVPINDEIGQFVLEASNKAA